MNARLLILKLAATLAALLAGGCVDVFEYEKPDGEEIVVPDPLRDDSPSVSGSSVAFSMNAEQFGTLAAWLGHENTLTIEKPVHVERDNVTLDTKAGTRFSYEMGDSFGKFTFDRPYPTVKSGFAKLIGGVSLHEVTLHADGSGLAATGLGRYRFRWLAEDEDAGTAAVANELPEVWAYSQPGCPPCVRARLELAAAKDLPFRVVWKEDAPSWLESRPAFWWHISADQPTQKDVNNTRQATGWNGIKDFTERWKNSRQPKRFQRTRTLAHNASHDCPHCGKAQYVIENEIGPVANSHSHRCGSCGTAWWHTDQ